MILKSHKAAEQLSALASTGVMTVLPGSVNTIPGLVRFSLDIRASKDSTVDTLEDQLRQEFDDAAKDPFSVTWKTINAPRHEKVCTRRSFHEINMAWY